LKADPSLARVRQWPNAVPQYSVGHLERVTRKVAVFDLGRGGTRASS
jgi:protoporphyrinogen oxidase